MARVDGRGSVAGCRGCLCAAGCVAPVDGEHPDAVAHFCREPDHLLLSPQVPRTPDATRASEIWCGRFAFAGKVL